MTSGPLLFGRYAYPPNELGYCGSDSSGTLLEYLDAGVTNEDLRKLASRFEGAWPYLTLIAEQTKHADILDPAVVHAYWVGNPLLERVRLFDFGNSLDERFRSRASSRWVSMTESFMPGAVPHHSFHVFCVYPWVGLLRSGVIDPAMHVLDRCRIRLGTVIHADNDRALVRSSRLAYIDGRIVPQPDVVESVRFARDGKSFMAGPGVGDIVTLHWDWVCDVVTEHEAAYLSSLNQRHMSLANRTLRGSLLDR